MSLTPKDNSAQYDYKSHVWLGWLILICFSCFVFIVILTYSGISEALLRPIANFVVTPVTIAVCISVWLYPSFFVFKFYSGLSKKSCFTIVMLSIFSPLFGSLMLYFRRELVILKTKETH